MHILIVGAHSDDGELYAGGSAALWRKRGDSVKFLSVTNGAHSHFDERYKENGEELSKRRQTERAASAAIIGASTGNLGIPDGYVYVNPELTEALVREIRLFGPKPGAGPDLIVTHRLFDSSRDHRYTARAVVDAAGLLTMPLICSDVPALRQTPAIAYWYDSCKEYIRFHDDMIVSIDSVIDVKTRLVAAHESQFFEFLPYNRGLIEHVPKTEEERLAWLRQTRIEPMGRQVRSAAAETLNASLPHGRYAESFQISESGRQPTRSELLLLFP
jgi:LmbE family N-acetylglucosaminyl deacetylase